MGRYGHETYLFDVEHYKEQIDENFYGIAHLIKWWKKINPFYCKQCGRKISPQANINRAYCSDRCRLKYYNQNTTKNEKNYTMFRNL